VVQVDRDVSCSLHDSRFRILKDSSILWQSFGPDCLKELDEKAISYGDQVYQLRVSGIPFSKVRNSVEIVVQSCQNLVDLCLVNVSVQEPDLEVLQGMAKQTIRIEDWKFGLRLSGETWTMELNPSLMRAEDVAVLAKYIELCSYRLKVARLDVIAGGASGDKGAFVTLLKSLEASQGLVLELRYRDYHDRGVSRFIDLLNLVFGASLHLWRLKVECQQYARNPTLQEHERLLALINEHSELVEVILGWPTKVLEARAEVALNRNLRLQNLWVRAVAGYLELGNALWGKVFLCGDGYAGKSTLTKSLVRLGQASGMCWSFTAACPPRPDFYEATGGIALARYEQERHPTGVLGPGWAKRIPGNSLFSAGKRREGNKVCAGLPSGGR
jgi:hypothetical protein